MNIYLLRHAHALDMGEAGVQTDEERPLSDEGHRQMEVVADGVKRLGLTFDQIISSPLRRAVETAQELCRYLGLPDSTIATWDQLEPGAPTKKLMKKLRTLESGDVVLVGHAPEMAMWAGWLIGGKDCQVEIPKAGLAYIRCDAPPRKGVGTLVWLLTPELLQGLHEEARGSKKAARA
jgi:phosphohistidine phosphatase